MPIYAYRCSSCHHTQDILRKISDPPLVTCTACGRNTFVKQVTSAGFALKGSGWYVTDFRGDGSGSKSSDGTASAPKSGSTASAGSDTAPATSPASGGGTAAAAPAASSSAAPAPSTPSAA